MRYEKLFLTGLLGACAACSTASQDSVSLPIEVVGEPADGEGPSGVAVLGNGSHRVDALKVDIVARARDGLNGPTDLAFHPEVAGQVWLTNRSDNSVVIFDAFGTATQTASRRSSAGSEHFLSKPAALAFGAAGVLATAQQEDQVTQPSTPADFMGPTLWTSDAATFDAGHSSHLDMLHNSPNASGIAWETGNAFWVYDGGHGALTRYDFQADHDLGGTDHQDGVVKRSADGMLGYLPGVPAHITLDYETGLLYAADPANNAIMVLDTKSGTAGGAIGPNYDGTKQSMIEGAMLTKLVDGAAVEGMLAPSGLELDEGILYVSDNQSSMVFAFDLNGKLLDYLPTGRPAGSLMGLAIGPDGSVHVVDHLANAVIRLSAKP
mgnify:CR=1 FL=1